MHVFLIYEVWIISICGQCPSRGVILLFTTLEKRIANLGGPRYITNYYVMRMVFQLAIALKNVTNKTDYLFSTDYWDIHTCTLASFYLTKVYTQKSQMYACCIRVVGNLQSQMVIIQFLIVGSQRQREFVDYVLNVVKSFNGLVSGGYISHFCLILISLHELKLKSIILGCGKILNLQVRFWICSTKICEVVISMMLAFQERIQVNCLWIQFQQTQFSVEDKQQFKLQQFQNNQYMFRQASCMIY
eukprot:TRINITY_DN1606_c0_g2_i3.p1 TRINITY_DN1606_c0_g2~~TRINITY_DN1606_c0_g2_i3.p1  ORF type:complete len:245 (+),score=-14.21 TRINITY_DN1606_c0_g2_i3:321-1055(+)